MPRKRNNPQDFHHDVGKKVLYPVHVWFKLQRKRKSSFHHGVFEPVDMRTIRVTEVSERVLAIVLPVVLILLLAANLVTRGMATGDTHDDLELAFDAAEHPIPLIHESVSSCMSYFVMIFVSTNCPSCRELLRDFDGSNISRYTEGNSRVLIVAPDTSVIASLLKTSRKDVFILEDHDNQLFRICKIKLVPTYMAILPSKKVAFKSSSALRALDWIALETGK
jgi:hypothetical protein